MRRRGMMPHVSKIKNFSCDAHLLDSGNVRTRFPVSGIKWLLLAQPLTCTVVVGNVCFQAMAKLTSTADTAGHQANTAGYRLRP